MSESEPRLILCSALGDADAAPAAAALAVAATRRAGAAEDRAAGVLVADLRPDPRPLRGTVLASTAARELEAAVCVHPQLQAVARGRVCFASVRGQEGWDVHEVVSDLLDPGLGAELVVVVCAQRDLRELIEGTAGRRRGVLLRGVRGADRPLIAMLAAELRGERIPFRAWLPPIGFVAARRALAGLDPGGESGRRAMRLLGGLVAIRGRSSSTSRIAVPALGTERAQALPAVLGIAILIVALALILLALGSAATAKGRLQRATDLAAISAARSMRDDFARLFVPPLLPSGAPNPAHLDRDEYLARARAAGAEAADRNDLDPSLIAVRFPGEVSVAPMRVLVVARVRAEVGGEEAPTSARAEAEIDLGPEAGSPPAATAEGGGYSGPLAYRQGKPMRPDVAEAFDRMSAAARADGVALTINSAYRSDAEQQRLWDANPDPRWVAPPGTSLHRCGTELDLGSAAAYGWLAANAGRFGFTQRYAWEAWHYGYDRGPAPCSQEANRVSAGSGRGDGRASGSGGLPSFVPSRYREPLLAASARNDVSAALLAAQIMAESGFDPNVVSPAGAQGISQFMPATAASYGLRDPFDPEASIAAQARMMSGLLKQFGGSFELALAAYNAGPGAVSACGCVPPYPETQAYVARIMALLDGAGQLAQPPVLEVRLVS